MYAIVTKHNPRNITTVSLHFILLSNNLSFTVIGKITLLYCMLFCATRHVIRAINVRPHPHDTLVYDTKIMRFTCNPIAGLYLGEV